MKKYYYIYEIKDDWSEKKKKKSFSEHSAIHWIEEHLKQPKYKNSKFKIESIYKN